MKTVPWLLALALAASAVAQPAPSRTFSATDFGVVGDGVALNTAALQRAIDTCSARGGGSLVLPAGRYLTGTIELKDGVTLQLDEHAVLLGSTSAADYRNVDPFTDGTGSQLGYALVVAVGAKHVGITGTGAIDGQGKALAATQSPYAVRPFLVRWVRCTDVAVSGVQLRNSGAWTMHFFQTKNARVDRVTIRSRGLSNNDGIDIDSCEGVRIDGCDIDTGDDAICLKATSAQPCRDIAVADCRLTSNCAAIKFGTESLGDFTDIRIARCQIRDTRLGGIKLFSVDGAHLRDVTFTDITMENVVVPIMIRLGARLKTFRPGDAKKPPGLLRGVTFRNIRATSAHQIGMLISGVPGHRVENLTFENIAIELDGGGRQEDVRPIPENEAAYPEIRMFGPAMPASGIFLRHARGVKFTNVRTSVAALDTRPTVALDDVEDLTPADFAGPQKSPR